MRILILNYFYPPVVDAHAYRWEQIARCWVAQGHQVDVVCGRLRGVPNPRVQAGVNVTRVGPVRRSTMLFTPPVGGGTDLRTRLTSAIVKALRSAYRGLYWPDAWWHWWPSALREVLKRSEAYDLVVSYSPCLGAHLVAAALKQRARSSGLVWIADYGDPFSTSSTMRPNNFAVYRGLNGVAERHIASRANAVVFTNYGTAADYRPRGYARQTRFGSSRTLSTCRDCTPETCTSGIRMQAPATLETRSFCTSADFIAGFASRTCCSKSCAA